MFERIIIRWLILSSHNTKLPPKGDRGVSFVQAKALYQGLGIVIAIGMRKYRSPKEQNV